MTTALYRDFHTTAELDEQYDIEATVADFGAYADDFVERSAAYRDRATAHLDVRFGPTDAETYDVFTPPGAFTGPRPALYFIHGGYWKATTSKVWSYVAEGLCERGHVVVVTNYALCPEVSVAEIVRQHRAAYAHFYAHAADHRVDPDHIVIAGHSAGGHGVAALLATDWVTDHQLPAVPFAGALAVSGLFDLRPLPHTFVNTDLGLDAATAEALSMLTVPQAPAPMVIAHGTAETEEFARQSVDHHAMLVAAGADATLIALECNHFDILESMADGVGPLAQAIVGLTGLPRT